MLWAFLTLILWTLSCLVSRQAAVLLGAVTANRWRLVVAALLLGSIALALGSAFAGPWSWWFVASGVAGLGFGDVALFIAYRRLGTRLAALMTYCLGVIAAAGLEWLWLGNGLTALELVTCGVVVAGVALATGSSAACLSHGRDLRLGLLAGICSALGLAVGAVLTRKAAAVAAATGIPASGFAGGCLRTLGGLALLMVVWPLTASACACLAHRNHEEPRERPDWRRGWPWLIATGVVGPGLGVATYQLALLSEKAGVVQAILAGVPVAVMPLSWWFEGDRPKPIAIVGGLIAAAGAAGLALLHAAGYR